MFKCFASCAFGLESVVASELKVLGFKNVEPRDARVFFVSDKAGIARANIWLRAADRVYIEAGEFKADTFESLFENVYSIDWQEYIPKDAAFPVSADTVRSTLRSVPDIQSVSKKAVAEKLKKAYGCGLSETGERYGIHIKLLGDIASACINTSGAGLNRRGYRRANVDAPLRETLAAGLVLLSGWTEGDFCDPMCGSGTIAIEAALIGSNTAPGLGRGFDAEKWRPFENVWAAEREHARSAIKKSAMVCASDTDGEALDAAERNAKAAGAQIRIYRADIRDFSRTDALVITNPPYALRLGEKEDVRALYRDMGRALSCVRRKYILTADGEFERFFGRRAVKKRKLYNGNVRCTFYQYF
mgnify:CR=1 FL=1